MLYERLEPFGESRADWRMAVLAAQTHNLYRGKDDPAVTSGQFLEMLEQEGEEPTYPADIEQEAPGGRVRFAVPEPPGLTERGEDA